MQHVPWHVGNAHRDIMFAIHNGVMTHRRPPYEVSLDNILLLQTGLTTDWAATTFTHAQLTKMPQRSTSGCIASSKSGLTVLDPLGDTLYSTNRPENIVDLYQKGHGFDTWIIDKP